jgi:hypothetical protein
VAAAASARSYAVASTRQAAGRDAGSIYHPETPDRLL